MRAADEGETPAEVFAVVEPPCEQAFEKLATQLLPRLGSFAQSEQLQAEGTDCQADRCVCGGGIHIYLVDAKRQVTPIPELTGKSCSGTADFIWAGRMKRASATIVDLDVGVEEDSSDLESGVDLSRIGQRPDEFR